MKLEAKKEKKKGIGVAACSWKDHVGNLYSWREVVGWVEEPVYIHNM